MAAAAAASDEEQEQHEEEEQHEERHGEPEEQHGVARTESGAGELEFLRQEEVRSAEVNSYLVEMERDITHDEESGAAYEDAEEGSWGPLGLISFTHGMSNVQKAVCDTCATEFRGQPTCEDDILNSMTPQWEPAIVIAALDYLKDAGFLVLALVGGGAGGGGGERGAAAVPDPRTARCTLNHADHTAQ